MKYVGFIKEHSPIDVAIPYSTINSSAKYDDELISQILTYLAGGLLVFSWMRYVNDVEYGNPICPDGYYSDGQFVWPQYLGYYLKRNGGYPIDEDFIEHMKSKDFINTANKDNVDEIGIENELSEKFRNYARHHNR